MSSHKQRFFTVAVVLLSLVTVLGALLLCSRPDNRAYAVLDPAPDLVVESINWLPEAPVIGNIAIATVTIVNQGNSPANLCEIAYYIDDVYYRYSPVGYLPPGSSVTDTFSWKSTAGEHIITTVVDRYDNVTESDEENNHKSFAVSVLAPDLTVHSITNSTDNASAGDEVTFTIYIKNQGTYRASPSNVGFYIDGNYRTSRQLPVVEPGITVNVTFPWLAKTGSHEIKAITDEIDQVKEIDETNNEYTIDYETAKPDLLIESLTWSPEDIVLHLPVTYTITVSNNGTGRAMDSVLALYIDEKLATTKPIGQMNPGSTATATYDCYADEIPRSLRAVIDGLDEITESDETNNERTEYPNDVYPDIIIKDIRWSPDPPLIAHQMTFTVILENRGKASCDSMTVDLYIDEKYKLFQKSGSIDIGETISANFTWLTQSDSLTVRAVADESNILRESNETNNTRTETVGFVEVSPTADLVIQDISYSPASPSLGEDITVSVRIKNSGTGNTGASYVKYLLDGEVLESEYTNSINAGDEIISTHVWSGEAGKHTIGVIIDGTGVINETDEDNNEGSVTISVYAPDLYVQGITWEPTIPSLGDTIEVNVVITNLGDREAGGSYISYYVDDDYRGNHHIEEIAPDATITKTFSWQAEAVTHTFRVVLDEDNTINESNEDNNVRLLLLPAPDLVVENIEFSPEFPTENETVTLTVTVRNQGNGKSGGTSLAGYVDDEAVAAVDIDEINPDETAEGTFIWTAVPGEHSVSVTADADNGITEIDETNNGRMDTIWVPAPGEEIPESLPTDEAEPSAGETPDAQSEGQDTSPAAAGNDEADTTAGNAGAAWYEKILSNYWYIIGLAVLGAGAIVLLLILRRKSAGQ